MQLYPARDPHVEEDGGGDDDMTRARVCQLTKRLAERTRASPDLVEGVPAEEIPRIRWGDWLHDEPPREQAAWARRDECANHYLGSPGARSSPAMQRLHELMKARRYDEVRDELAQAELSGEISEFCTLNSQAILAIVEGAEFASDYLEMAEAVASSPYELAVVAENRAAYDLLRGNPLAAAEHCLTALSHVYQTEGLWNNLLIALYRLGEVDAIDATLRHFTRLDGACTARLVRVLASEPDLRELHVWPAFQQLVDKQG